MTSIIPISNFSYSNLKEKAVQVGLDLFGGRNKTVTVSNDKAIKNIKFIGQKISSPQNRLILGVTALFSQPFIDAANKKVDSETKKVSVCRTLAKIIVGTTTGVLIRWGCIRSIDAFTKLPSQIPANAKFKKLKSCLLPSVKYTAEMMSNYKSVLGTLLGLAVMTYTNFSIDAPLTRLLTNVFVKGVNKHENK